jgi:hypothetical protein
MKAAKRKIILFVTGLLLLTSFKAKPQQSRTLFFMHDLPQAAYINPAIQPGCRWFIGIPALSSMYINASSTGLSYNDLSPGGEFIDADAIAQGLHSIDFFTTELNVNLISLGYKRKEYYYSFNIAEKVDIKVFYPSHLIELAAYGNDQFIANTMITRGLGAYAIHYREYSFGIAQNFESYYLWGLRGKLLFGKANLTTRMGAISLATQENTYNLLTEWAYQVNGSFPLSVSTISGEVDFDNIEFEELNPTNYLLNHNNLGFAVDFGAVYVNEPITWSASILDFGFIRWRSDTHIFKNNGKVAFDGITVDDIINPDEFLSMVSDSLNNQLKVTHTDDSYLTMLPKKLNLGATYQFHPKVNAGVMLRTEFYPRRPVPSLTFSINTVKLKNIAASLTYSIMNGSYNNIGLGLGFGFQNLGIHLISDNLLAFLVPHKAQTANLRFGVHLLFGCKEKQKKLPYKGPGCYWDGGKRNQK